MLLAILFWGFILADLTGMLMAGYFGMIKAPIQAVLAVWANLQLFNADVAEIDNTRPTAKRGLLLRIFKSKFVQKLWHYRQEKLDEVLHGHPARAILSIVLYVYILGFIWVGIRCTYTDWRVAFADEIKELVVIGWILVFFFLLLLRLYEGYRTRVGDAEDRADVDVDPEATMLDRAYQAMGAAGRYTGDMMEANLVHLMGLLFLMICSIGFYWLGVSAHSRWPMGILGAIREWHF